MKRGMAPSLAAVSLSASIASSTPVQAHPAGVEIGVLSRHEANGWGVVFGASNALRRAFSNGKDSVEPYDGRVSRFGVLLGYQKAAGLIWTVFAPTDKVRGGALTGHHGGVTARASLGVGGGAKALIGGSTRTITLQPLGIEGATGDDRGRLVRAVLDSGVLVSERHIIADADGSIRAAKAGLFARPGPSATRREIAPFIYKVREGDRWAFETKRGGLEILETAGGAEGRQRVAWYEIADVVQPLMSVSLAIVAAGLVAWPGAATPRRVRALRASNKGRLSGGLLFVHVVLWLHLAAAAALTFLVLSDWAKRQMFDDAVDPWLVALYVDAWTAVLATPIAAWIAFRAWRQGDAGFLTRSYVTLVVAAMLVSTGFWVSWHVAGATLKHGRIDPSGRRDGRPESPGNGNSGIGGIST